MEVPLQPFLVANKKTKKECFNPCFNGSSSSTYIVAAPKARKLRVSILVLMEVPLQPEKIKNKINIQWKFQSLF